MKTVKRIRFTEQGEIIQEDTFATENAARPQQLELAIGSGEQPIDTLPLFAATPHLARRQPEKGEA